MAEINKIIADFDKIKVPSTNPLPYAKTEKKESSHVYTNEYYDSEYYEEEENNIMNQQQSFMPDGSKQINTTDELINDLYKSERL